MIVEMLIIAIVIVVIGLSFQALFTLSNPPCPKCGIRRNREVYSQKIYNGTDYSKSASPPNDVSSSDFFDVKITGHKCNGCGHSWT